ncbi:MAG: hypothetical protein EA369_05330 [Bradymonadales bacterium]|nr:MAG: hypothetical protein EA369_05330 [Bradymonadales bacterium]
MFKQSLVFMGLGYLIGLIGFYLSEGGVAAIWFSLGAAISAFNFVLGVYLVRTGFDRISSKPMLLGLIFLKSLAFLALVGAVLVVAKPQFLAFTLGIGLVIFGLTLWALNEGRKIITRKLS